MPLQMVLAPATVKIGIGLTVTSIFIGAPGQFKGLGPIGLITYLTIPTVVPVFVSIWLIFVAAPLLNPVTEPEIKLAVNENVAPVILGTGL